MQPNLHSFSALYALLGLSVFSHADPRTSASYVVTAESTDAGGQRSASANYANDGSAGMIAGISVGAPSAETAKSGYLAQLYEIVGLAVNAATPAVNEGTSLQLGAWQLLDDGTFLSLDAGTVTWGTVITPNISVGTSGVATAGAVYQNTPATVTGTFGGFTATFDLTVLNVNPDDLGSYAGDGIADDWQVQYFGFDNPSAAPLLDPDGDGQSNVFEFTAGLVPTDPASLFRLRVEGVPGQAAQKKLIFSPRLNDRTYTIEYRLSLGPGLWATLNGTSFIDNADTRTVTDPNATDATRFYRVQIKRP